MSIKSEDCFCPYAADIDFFITSSEANGELDHMKELMLHLTAAGENRILTYCCFRISNLFSFSLR